MKFLWSVRARSHPSSSNILPATSLSAVSEIQEWINFMEYFVNNDNYRAQSVLSIALVAAGLCDQCARVSFQTWRPRSWVEFYEWRKWMNEGWNEVSFHSKWGSNNYFSWKMSFEWRSPIWVNIHPFRDCLNWIYCTTSCWAWAEAMQCQFSMGMKMAWINICPAEESINQRMPGGWLRWVRLLLAQKLINNQFLRFKID